MNELLEPIITIYVYGAILLFFCLAGEYDSFGKAISRAILWPIVLLVFLIKELKSIWKEL